MRRYSPKEVATALGLCVETVRRAWRRQQLVTINSPSGHFKAVSVDALREWLTGNDGQMVLARSLRYHRRSNRRPKPTYGRPQTDMVAHGVQL